MSAGPPPRTAEDRRGRQRLLLGASFGVTGALIGLVVPVSVLLANASSPSGEVLRGATLVEVLAALFAAGLLLLTLSFVAYRSAFARLRRVDRRFWAASALCLVGSLGLLVLAAAAVVAGGSAATWAQCVHSSPIPNPGCLGPASGGAPLDAPLVGVGFGLAWIGSLGIVVGLALEGERARTRLLTAAAAAYAVTLLALLGPFASLFVSLPGTAGLAVAAPILAVIAPALVLAATRRR
ncbi:MAG TPA: hypothetical protein VGS23_08825 [Thermoplasmata archaeon]|nr:hypothetical protein [Thermoplasmata archaeon]